MHRGQHARAHQEGAQQAQGKGDDGKKNSPGLQGNPLFRNDGRMQQRRTRQPGHEGGVFHRVPEPPAAPAQLVIGPPGAEHDADGQERPGDNGPWPRPARPCSIQAAAQQRSDGEGEGDGEADIPHVQHRRVDDEAKILQQRVEVVSVGRIVRQLPVERIGGHQHEQQKADADHAHHGQHAAEHLFRQITREYGDGERPCSKDQAPEQQRPLMPAPYRAEAVIPGQRGVRIERDIGDTEIVGQKRLRQADEGKQYEQTLRSGRRLGEAHRQRVATPGAVQRNGGLQHRQYQRDDQGNLSKLGDHALSLSSVPRGRFRL